MSTVFGVMSSVAIDAGVNGERRGRMEMMATMIRAVDETRFRTARMP